MHPKAVRSSVNEWQWQEGYTEVFRASWGCWQVDWRVKDRKDWRSHERSLQTIAVGAWWNVNRNGVKARLRLR